jgi:TrpR-related protein YerC/YecD
VASGPTDEQPTRTTSDEPHHAWQTNEIKDLFRTVLSLETLDEAERFFRDLCTLSELEAMAHRWEVAKLLDRGLPYQEVAKEAHASTTTVTRVAHWLRHGEGGYRLAIERTQKRSGRA